MGNLLIAGERSNDPEFRLRYLHLFDVMSAGLSSFVDKEFFADANKTLNVVKLLNPIVDADQQLRGAQSVQEASSVDDDDVEPEPEIPPPEPVV